MEPQLYIIKVNDGLGRWITYCISSCLETEFSHGTINTVLGHGTYSTNSTDKRKNSNNTE